MCIVYNSEYTGKDWNRIEGRWEQDWRISSWGSDVVRLSDIKYFCRKTMRNKRHGLAQCCILGHIPSFINRTTWIKTLTAIKLEHNKQKPAKYVQLNEVKLNAVKSSKKLHLIIWNENNNSKKQLKLRTDDCHFSYNFL